MKKARPDEIGKREVTYLRKRCARKSSSRVEFVELVGELVANLLDDGVEEASGELCFDLLFEPPVRSNVGDIGLIGGAATASEHPDDTTIPAQDD